MDISKISAELKNLKRAVDKQANYQWHSFQSDLNNFYELLNSFEHYVDLKNRNKINIKLISPNHDFSEYLTLGLSNSKLLKDIVSCTSLTLEEALSCVRGEPIYRLVLHNGQSDAPIPFPISSNSTLRLGTHPAYSDIVVPRHYARVDRKHAVLFSALREKTTQQKVELSWFIRDLDSSTGTYLNQEKVEEINSVSPGDIITLGGKHASDGVPKFVLVKFFERNTGIEFLNLMPEADICVLLLGLEDELDSQEERVVNYISQLQTVCCLLLIHVYPLEKNKLESKIAKVNNWVKRNVTEKVFILQVDASGLISQDQDSREEGYTSIEDSLKEYLLSEFSSLDSEGKKIKNENLLLKSAVKPLKEQCINSRIRNLLDSARFINTFSQYNVYRVKPTDEQQFDTQALRKYLENKISEPNNTFDGFKNKVKSSRANLEKKTSHPNYFPAQVKSYIDVFVVVKTVKSAGVKWVKLTGIDGEDVNLFLLKYCRDTLVSQWLQQEENSLFYGEDGIGGYILDLAETLRDKYGVLESSLDKILDISIKTPDEAEIIEIFNEDCRAGLDSETYEASNLIFYLFGSLRKHLFQIMSPLILLTMLGIGSRTQTMQQITQAVGGNWILQLLAIGLVFFFFYTLVKNYLKDQQDRQNKAAEKVKEALRKLYVDFIKESLLDPAQETINRELERIFKEIKQGLNDIQAEYCTINQVGKDKQEQNDVPDLTAILASIEKIRQIAQNDSQ